MEVNGAKRDVKREEETRREDGTGQTAAPHPHKVLRYGRVSCRYDRKLIPVRFSLNTFSFNTC